MKFAVLAFCVLLAGCAGKVLSSTPRSVVVQAGEQRPDEASALAEAECAKHGRHARLIGQRGEMTVRYTFDCVQ